MTTVSGVRTTTNIKAERLQVDMAKEIAQLQPSQNPFLTLLKVAKKDSRAVYNPKFEWIEDDLLAIRTLANGANADATDTTLNVDDGSIFRPYDILNIPSTGEQLLVISISSNELTVVRGYGSTDAAAFLDNAEFIRVGNAQEENSSARAVRSTQEIIPYNFTQIFRTPVQLSGTEMQSKLYGGKDRAYQRKKAGIEHARDIALSMYFGQRKLNTTAGQTNTVRRTMGGVYEFLKTGNSVTWDSSTNALTYANFNEQVAQKVFAYGSDNKVLLCGPKMMNAINSWTESKVNTVVDDSTYGFNVKKLIFGYGTLPIIYDPLFGISAEYAKLGFVLDMDYIRYCYMDGRDTKLNTNIQNNDTDGAMDDYLTECSLEVKLPDTHMLLLGAY